MEVDVLVPKRERQRANLAKGKKGGKKGKESHSGKGHGESKIEHTRFDCECRNCDERTTQMTISELACETRYLTLRGIE